MSTFLHCNNTPNPNPSSQQQARSDWHKGITLFELITVVCLITIISGMGLLSFEPLWKKHQLEAASKDFKGKIQLYRMKAILENSTYQLQLNNNVLYIRKKKGESWSNWEKSILSDQIDYGVTGNIFFYQKGFASPKTLTLGSGAYNKKLILNINGRVRESKIY